MEADETLTAAARVAATEQLTQELHVWDTIEQLMLSPIVCAAVRDGALQLHGALLSEPSGEVRLLGQHPAFESLVVAEGLGLAS